MVAEGARWLGNGFGLRPRGNGSRSPIRRIYLVYAGLGLVVAGYLASLILRRPGQSWPLLDNWMVAFFELTAAALCLARGLERRNAVPIFPIILGCALLSWSLGDVALAAESLGGMTPMPPTVADAFYLGFYPLAYIAVVLLIRQEVTEFLPANWLDGAVAGLGAAGLCAAFAFGTIVRTLGDSPLTVATDLAYPIGDVLLFGLAAGGTAMLAGRRPRWSLLAGACAINAVGDTFNLVNTAGKASQIGLVFDGIAWPTAILLMSLAVWLPSSPRDMQDEARMPGFLLPALGACSSLGILVVSSFRAVITVAIALATLTLLTVGVRLAMSIRTLHSLSDQRRRLAHTDHLTGLGNRRQLDQALANFFEAMAQDPSSQRRLALLFIDLDHFKEINDSFGHGAGDELLRQLGPRLKASLRSSDLLFRLGGDELGVLLVDTDPDYCRTVAQRLLAALQAPFLLGDVSVRISASIGVAIAPTDASDGVGLLRCADLAMYRAKEAKSSVELYRQDLQDTDNRLMLVTELSGAVTHNQFLLHYQPQVDLRSHETVAYEALLRWPHPRLGNVPPLRFLPLAEEAGMMEQVTAFVLDRALAQLSAWRSTRPDVRVAVNISATNLLDARFDDLLQIALARYATPASALTLEITETTVLREFDRCKSVIARLHELGVEISMDDFGAGFTSLAYLAELALSEIKLDRAFTAALSSVERGRELVRATINLCHALGLRVVAEGIEDEATFALLAQLGCDLGQGYFIGKPAMAAHFESSPSATAA